MKIMNVYILLFAVTSLHVGVGYPSQSSTEAKIEQIPASVSDYIKSTDYIAQLRGLTGRGGWRVPTQIANLLRLHQLIRKANSQRKSQINKAVEMLQQKRKIDIASVFHGVGK